MLAFIRIILLAIAIVVIASLSILMCLFRPFHRNNVYRTAQWMAKVAYIVGVKIEVRVPASISPNCSYVYIGNHQNSYDLFTISKAVLPNTVSVGKKSLVWIPFFGQMYWLTGNILIDRNNKNKASNTITATVEKIKRKGISVWLFPEGTRSYGRGILPFKTGAFRTALQTGSAIVPCVCSNSSDIRLNRWNNGKLIIEYMDPIPTVGLTIEDIRKLANQTREQMTIKFEQLSQEANA
ncbi:1-acylglycerol-3-phosphate O-acyltransferase [Thalassotalea sp. PP2-459]|uniref:1-acylglycerol-3-phosphate O-acyltransferase n=1 Tax=Thalassotalea sp. PP2-459 TaxID=1742724 RepID=UPI00094335E9|nr:1-acylglycerol-3-phosphate O-acyltransferase [Thalassotalea sp. PP2-459]OKY28086.1 1-acyl-sn-glycerol-3-phosphate acyltransferase [Thalassotalea sp. PP2-459]